MWCWGLSQGVVWDHEVFAYMILVHCLWYILDGWHGSTGDFISEVYVKHPPHLTSHKLPVKSHHGQQDGVAGDGNRKHVVRESTTCVLDGGLNREWDVSHYTLGGYDVVLGVPWFQSTTPAITDVVSKQWIVVVSSINCIRARQSRHR